MPFESRKNAALPISYRWLKICRSDLVFMESTNTDQSARRVEVVVMFTDIVDFTAYSDAHGEEASLAIVTRHENLVFPIVTSHGGTIVKTIGDAVMAYFSDAEQAALAGRAIMKAV